MTLRVRTSLKHVAALVGFPSVSVTSSIERASRALESALQAEWHGQVYSASAGGSSDKDVAPPELLHDPGHLSVEGEARAPSVGQLGRQSVWHRTCQLAC